MSRVIIGDLKMPIYHEEREVIAAAEKAAAKCGIRISSPFIYKKSLDARRKTDIHYVYSVAADAPLPKSGKFPSGITVVDTSKIFDIEKAAADAGGRGRKIVIVGSGPCGLFAAYVLSKCGMQPIVIERGADVDTRTEKVNRFWKTGVLDPNTNVQFGEGGAGTFSDGKLNSRIGDPMQRFILETFAENGAPRDILYQAKPHIGTDKLSECVKNIRNKIVENGGEVRFNTCMTDIKIKNDRVYEIELSDGNTIPCDALVLALGHSSRDTYEMLYRRGMAMEQKPFAAGVRIEHSREFINRVQYGDMADCAALPTADYRLAYNGADRSCYSFCMCPGGVVVNASSEEGHTAVNGMSCHDRMDRNSNSALVVNVRSEDFDGNDPLAGVRFQRKYEKLAYDCAEGRGAVQLAADFVEGRTSREFCSVMPSFTGETAFVDLRRCLPEFISDALCEGLIAFDRKMKGYSSGDAVMTGVETRTSAPLRIKRGIDFESINIKGIFPSGEGAGYAGGIMSAAIDGVRVACRIMGL